MAENFDLIFGQSASTQYAWNDSDYQNGWGTVGSTPPTAEQFDALQRRSDKKAQELNNALTPLVNQNTASNRQPVTAYVEKDIRYSTLLPTGWYLECTTAGITDSGDITLPSPLVENATITDGTCVWKVRKISSADGMPIGAIIAYGGNGNIPSGYLLCDGAAYSRTAFPDLFATIGTDYGSGDGSTTFNVPDANQAKRFLQGDTVAGTVKSAGLPNITANFGNVHSGNAGIIVSGAFEKTATVSYQVSAGSSATFSSNDTNFDASRSSNIYGNSTTVQPDALTTRYIIKAFDGQTADSALVDITQFENELGNKADRSLSNLTDAGKSFSFPSSTYLDVTSSLTWTVSGTHYEATYTAPADGYLSVTAKTSSGGVGEVSIYNTSNAFGSTDSVGIQDIIMKGMTILSKGQRARIVLDNSIVQNAIFVYCNGEVPN